MCRVFLMRLDSCFLGESVEFELKSLMLQQGDLFELDHCSDCSITCLNSSGFPTSQLNQSGLPILDCLTTG